MRTDLNNEQVTRFAYADVERGLIAYKNTQAADDAVQLIARVAGVAVNTSEASLRVSVVKSNDESPKIIVNLPLELFDSSSAVITRDMLAATDVDSRPEEIKYKATPPSNGKLIVFDMNGNAHVGSLEFSQADINERRVSFLHSGGRVGGFRFETTDGKHPGGQYAFKVVAKQIKVGVTVCMTLRRVSGRCLRS